jgi:hypothetical protein
MQTLRFHPGQSFDEVRAALAGLNSTENRHRVATLTWREGNAKDQSIAYLYDEMADRFGHSIDKESIGVEIVSSLMSGIPVDVSVADAKAEKRR